jgi:hypothetical protein
MGKLSSEKKFKVVEARIGSAVAAQEAESHRRRLNGMQTLPR